jgi:hypothetical protein
MFNSLSITVEPCKGANIRAACDNAKELSELIKREITFTFNGVIVTTAGWSINEMVERYMTHRTP